MKKSFKIAAYTLLSILFILVTGMWVILCFYENDVKTYIIGQLNKQLNTKVIVEGKDIKLSFWNSFPLASLDFNHVKALDTFKGKQQDTLFKADNIALEFNLIDLFNKNYKIKRIEVRDGEVNVKINGKGQDNYHFWKSSNDTTNTAFSFALQKIIFRDVDVSWVNRQKKADYDILIRKDIAAGKFSNDNYELDSKGRFHVNHIIVDGTRYVSDRPLSMNIRAHVDNKTNTYQIYKGHVTLAALNLNLQGHFIAGKKNRIALKVAGDNLDIQSVVSLLPPKYRKKLQDYHSAGNFYFTSLIKGKISTNTWPELSASFGVKDGTISPKDASVQLKQVNLEGAFSAGDIKHPEDSHLDINNFNALLKEGKVEGSFSVRDFKHPYVEVNANMDLKLPALLKLFPVDTIQQISGELNVEGVFKGQLSNPKKYIADDFQEAETSGKITASDVSFRLKNNPLTYDHFNASCLLKNNDLVVDSLDGDVGHSDFKLRGTFQNLLAYIFVKNEDLAVNASLDSKNIDLNELLASKDNTSTTDTSYHLHFSKRLDMRLRTNIGQIVFRRFKASKIRGTVTLNDKQLSTDKLSFSTMDGTVTTSGTIDDNYRNKILTSCDAKVSKINITKLFYEMEDFGQNVMKSNNIKGLVTADVQYAAVWSPSLDIDPASVYAKSNMTIEKGELINFKPMESLSRFVKVSELKDIKFSTLKNQIEVKHRTIYIPEMSIRSSALNFDGSGTETFDEVIDYKIKILLSELLSKKARKAKKENTEFGVVQDDGLGKTTLFLSMTGTVDNPVIKYDRKGAKQKIKNDVKNEKVNLKTVLHDEFGWFKKDTAVTKRVKEQKAKKKKGHFIIQWGNDTTKTTAPPDDSDSDY